MVVRQLPCSQHCTFQKVPPAAPIPCMPYFIAGLTQLQVGDAGTEMGHTQFVCEDCHNFVLLALLKQRVIQDYAHPRQPGQAIPAKPQQSV